jgi:putative tricarboxylic transport membrane protein
VSDATGAVDDRANVKDAVAGAIVAVAGGILLLDALSFTSPSAQADAVGPRLFPLVASGILVLGGLSLVVTGLRATQRAGASSDEPPVPLGRLAVVIAIFVGFLLIFEPVGFLISTALFMSVMTTYVRPDRVKSNVVVGIATSCCIYFSFIELLGVGLPVGVLG